MPIPPSVPLQVKLGDLAFADVGVPGRRRVHHPQRGWVAEPDQRSRFRVLPVWMALLLPLLLPLGVLVGLLAPRALGEAAPRGGLPVPALSASSSAPVAATVAVTGPAVALPAPAPVLSPSPPAARMPPIPLPTVEAMAPQLPSTPASRGTRPPARSSPRRAAAASAPIAPVFNDTPVVASADLPFRDREVLVAIKDGQTIVVPDRRGLPTPFRVGDQLPSGARLLRVDALAGEARTDRGVMRLE